MLPLVYESHESDNAGRLAARRPPRQLRAERSSLCRDIDRAGPLFEPRRSVRQEAMMGSLGWLAMLVLAILFVIVGVVRARQHARTTEKPPDDRGGNAQRTLQALLRGRGSRSTADLVRALRDREEELPPLTHDGIHEVDVGRASEVHYCHRGTWHLCPGGD